VNRLIKNIAGAACQLNPHQSNLKEIISWKDIPVWILTPQGRRLAGIITRREGKTLFEKQVQSSKHFLKILNGWGFQEELLNEFKVHNVEEIHVEDVESSKKYITSLFTLIRNGIQGDYGHGMQIFLPLKFWTETKTGNNQLSLLGDELNE
jgi:hypothetical protein